MNDLIPCLGVFGVLTVIFGFLAFLRYMNYKETIALAEKGGVSKIGSKMRG